jgi:hypothetical protein
MTSRTQWLHQRPRERRLTQQVLAVHSRGSDSTILNRSHFPRLCHQPDPTTGHGRCLYWFRSVSLPTERSI